MDYTEINHPIQVSDIIGTYNLTAYSKKMMYYEGKYHHIPNSTLQLNTDSTYIITNAPDWLNNSFGESSQQYFTKRDKWLMFYDAKNGSMIELEGIDGGQLLTSKKNKIYILLTIGDPDSCQGIVYEKQ